MENQLGITATCLCYNLEAACAILAGPLENQRLAFEFPGGLKGLSKAWAGNLFVALQSWSFVRTAVCLAHRFRGRNAVTLNPLSCF